MNPAHANDRRCPLCYSANECRIANGCTYKGACWCETIFLPAPLQRYLAELFQQRACFCRDCLKLLAVMAAENQSPQAIVEKIRARAADSYIDNDGRVVFTAAYHLRRGHCCGNGCRHCPFTNKMP
jgi:hypothetical protein